MNIDDKSKFQDEWERFVVGLTDRKSDLERWTVYFDELKHYHFAVVKMGLRHLVSTWEMSTLPKISHIKKSMKEKFATRKPFSGVDCCDGYGRTIYNGTAFTSGCMHSFGNFEGLKILTSSMKSQIDLSNQDPTSANERWETIVKNCEPHMKSFLRSLSRRRPELEKLIKKYWHADNKNEPDLIKSIDLSKK